MSDIIIQPTPNPNALKFITTKTLKTEGKSSFKNPNQAKDIPLAAALFDLRGVDQIHFFQNVVTLSKFTFEPWDSLEPAVMTCIETFIEDHDPDFKEIDPEAERRKHLPKELAQIESVIDKHIRAALQADGGDVQCVSYADNILIIKYQGACGTCPSSTGGTLEGIRAILKENFNPNIEVYIAPEE
ncbi:MAG: NifU family protein [Bacteriovoracaceae bacterium]|nr:NifU family protein [Bacteriovoracaceae bacterium]